MGNKNIQSIAKILLICLFFLAVGVLAVKLRSKEEPVQSPDKEIVPVQETKNQKQKVKYTEQKDVTPIPKAASSKPKVKSSIIPSDSRRFSGGDEVIPPPPITYRTAEQRPAQADRGDSRTAGSSLSGMELKGVVAMGDDSYAIIRDSKSQKDHIYHLNDTIQGSKITEISRNKVVLEAGNGQQPLSLFKDGSQTDSNGTTGNTDSGRVFGPVSVNGPPPVDPSKSSLGEDIARRLPAAIRQKERYLETEEN